MSRRLVASLLVRGSSPVWPTAASTARWQGKVRPPIATTMSAKRSSPSRASIRAARRPGIENLPLLPLTESSAAAAAWRHAWMAVVGWLEVGGTLRISPLFLESASWMRFERSASIRTFGASRTSLAVRSPRTSAGGRGPGGLHTIYIYVWISFGGAYTYWMNGGISFGRSADNHARGAVGVCNELCG